MTTFQCYRKRLCSQGGKRPTTRGGSYRQRPYKLLPGSHCCSYESDSWRWCRRPVILPMEYLYFCFPLRNRSIELSLKVSLTISSGLMDIQPASASPTLTLRRKNDIRRLLQNSCWRYFDIYIHVDLLTNHIFFYQWFKEHDTPSEICLNSRSPMTEKRRALTDKTNASEFSTTSTANESPPGSPTLKTAQTRGIKSRLSQYITFILSSFKSQWASTSKPRRRQYAHMQKRLSIAPSFPLPSVNSSESQVYYTHDEDSIALLQAVSSHFTTFLSPHLTYVCLADRPSVFLLICIFSHHSTPESMYLLY